jgi:hypothetical protein
MNIINKRQLYLNLKEHRVCKPFRATENLISKGPHSPLKLCAFVRVSDARDGGLGGDGGGDDARDGGLGWG